MSDKAPARCPCPEGSSFDASCRKLGLALYIGFGHVSTFLPAIQVAALVAQHVVQLPGSIRTDCLCTAAAQGPEERAMQYMSFASRESTIKMNRQGPRSVAFCSWQAVAQPAGTQRPLDCQQPDDPSIGRLLQVVSASGVSQPPLMRRYHIDSYAKGLTR